MSYTLGYNFEMISEMCHSSLQHPEGILAFFLLGLAGSLHCVGMCGPISSIIFSRNNHKRFNQYFIISKYHLGRLFGYLFISTTLYYIGLPFKELISEKYLSYIAIAFITFYILGYSLEKYFYPFIKISQKITKFSTKLGRWKSLILGLSSSLLPCGLLYAAFMGSLATSSLTESWISIGSFFVGTVPLLALSQLGYEKINQYIKAPYRKWIQTGLGLGGILFLILYKI